MKLILDVENTVTKTDGKLHLDPFTPSNSLVMVGVCPVDGDPAHYTFDHEEYDCKYEYRKRDCDAIQEMLDNCELLIGHNISHDLQWLWSTGFKYDGKVWDTMLAEYLLQRGVKQPLGLEAIAERRDLEFKKQDTLKEYMKQGLTVDKIPYEELKEYLYGDLMTTRALYNSQLYDYENIDSNRILTTVLDLTMDTCQVLSRIYANGFQIDTDALTDVRKEFEQEKQTLTSELNKQVRTLMGDRPVNLNSPEQLSWVIFSRKPKDKTQWANKFDPYMSHDAFKRFINESSVPVRKTQAIKCKACLGSGQYYKVKKDGSNYKKPTRCEECGGAGFIQKELNQLAGLKFNAPGAKWHSANGFSTSKNNLEFLSNVAKSKNMDEAASFLDKIKRLSALDTYLSSFVDGIYAYIKPDNKLHVRLTQHMTSTGRFSGRDPNMQNMPRGGTFPVKKVFVSRWDGGKIMEADFAQLEFRVAAYLSQDETAMKEVKEGFDVHAYTAKIISEAGQATTRQEAKAHTFAPLYGATGHGRTPAEAAYYKHFLEKYTGIAKWHKELATECLTHKCITTPSGRQFSFPDVKRRKDGTITAFTAVKNYPVQSFATADIVPAVLLQIQDRMSDLQSLIVNSVHDSIVIDIHPDEEQQVLNVIEDVNADLKNIIDNTFNIDFNVPLLLEAKIGVNWLEQTDV